MKILLTIYALSVIAMASLCAYVFLDTFMVAVVFLPLGLALSAQVLSTLFYVVWAEVKQCLGMQNKFSTKLTRHLVYGGLYWGFYALGHHFCSQIEIDEINILHESGIEPILASIFVYIVSAFCVTIMSDTMRSTSHSQESSDKQSQSQT